MQRKKEDLCGVRDVQMLVATVLSVLRCVIPVVCGKTNTDVNFSQETQL